MTARGVMQGARTASVWIGIVLVVLGAGKWIQWSTDATAEAVIRADSAHIIADSALREATRMRPAMDTIASGVRVLLIVECDKNHNPLVCDHVRPR